jgi:hypothetical protein
MKYRNMLWLVAMLLFACTTAAATQPRANSVVFEVHSSSYDEVWQAATSVADRLLTVTESDKRAGTLKASRGVVMGPWGDVVDFSIRPVKNDASTYRIEISSLKHPDTQLSRQDWVNTMIYRIKAELQQ